ncbi:hypothetical protein [Streptomyces sp. NPDC127092]|uniref:hypothetical protein n=1 Tax=Streptomyces sp. NPDC127092 TaxID=3347135 RepID=UPI00364E0BC6
MNGPNPDGRERMRDEREPGRQRAQDRQAQQGQGRARAQGQQGQQGRQGGQGPQGRQGQQNQRQGQGQAQGQGARRRGGGPLGPLLRECAPPYRRTSGQIAAVMLYRKGGHRIVWPDRKEDVDKPFLRTPYTIFEVQLGRHVTEFELQLPAAGDGSSFSVRVRVQWTVEDPYLVVKEQAWNVAELLHDDLLDGLRSLSRRFRLTEAQRADEAVRDELASGRLVIGRDIGLRTQVYVFFDLAEPTREEVARGDLVGVASRSDDRVAEAELRREEWERRRIAARAADLEAMFRRGDLAQIAHHMARHPDQEWEIRTQLQREKREGQADLLAVFNKLLDSGVLERHEIDEQAYQILQHLRGSTGTILGGVADRVLETTRHSGPRALEPSRPEPTAPNWGEESLPDAPEDPRVYEPTRVQASFETEDPEDPEDADGRGDRKRGDDAYDTRGSYGPHDGGEPYDAPRRPSRPSAEFDDWDDE